MDRSDSPGPPFLTTYLADRDEPCPGCAYNLRGLLTNRCPECNQELMLRVGLVEPRMAWFLVALIGASAGLGLNLLLLIYLAIVSMMRYGGPPWGYFFGHNLVGAIVHGLCVALLVHFGPRLRRGGLTTRIALAIAMLALSLVNIALFTVFIR